MACGEILVEALADRDDRIVVYGAHWPPPPDPRVRIVPLVDPVLLFPWSLLWLRDNTHPRLHELVTEVAGAAPATDHHRDSPIWPVWAGVSDRVDP